MPCHATVFVLGLHVLKPYIRLRDGCYFYATQFILNGELLFEKGYINVGL